MKMASGQGKGRWELGILIAADPQPIDHVSITGNSIRGADKGVAFLHDGFTQTPLCALNRIADDVAEPLSGFGVLPGNSLVVGGGLSRGGNAAKSGAGRLLAGPGDPNNKVIGHVGDLFQRLDGTPGQTLYVKETGNNTEIGWTAK